VRAPAARLGVVRAVRFRSRLDRPDQIVVGGGLLGNREHILAIAEVLEIVPGEELILVRTSWGRPAATGTPHSCDPRLVENRQRFGQSLPP